MRSIIYVCLLLLCLIGLGGKSYSIIKVKATAYCPCSICTDGDGITSTGGSAYGRGVAVDPRIIPLHSRIDIPGYGNWIKADDTGGLIKGRRIDVRFQDHEEAIDYGTKYIRIRVWQ